MLGWSSKERLYEWHLFLGTDHFCEWAGPRSEPPSAWWPHPSEALYWVNVPSLVHCILRRGWSGPWRRADLRIRWALTQKSARFHSGLCREMLTTSRFWWWVDWSPSLRLGLSGFPTEQHHLSALHWPGPILPKLSLLRAGTQLLLWSLE